MCSGQALSTEPSQIFWALSVATLTPDASPPLRPLHSHNKYISALTHLTYPFTFVKSKIAEAASLDGHQVAADNCRHLSLSLTRPGGVDFDISNLSLPSLVVQTFCHGPLWLARLVQNGSGAH